LTHEQRRSRERARVVVEPFARVVLRQERGGIDLHAQEISDGVRILSAIEPLQPDAPRSWSFRSRLIEVVFQRGNERFDPRGIGLRVAGRRHESATQLSYDALEGLCLVRHVLGRHGIERDVGSELGGVVAVDAVALQ
jgi:hypothetical protein